MWFLAPVFANSPEPQSFRVVEDVLHLQLHTASTDSRYFALELNWATGERRIVPLAKSASSTDSAVMLDVPPNEGTTWRAWEVFYTDASRRPTVPWVDIQQRRDPSKESILHPIAVDVWPYGEAPKRWKSQTAPWVIYRADEWTEAVETELDDRVADDALWALAEGETDWKHGKNPYRILRKYYQTPVEDLLTGPIKHIGPNFSSIRANKVIFVVDTARLMQVLPDAKIGVQATIWPTGTGHDLHQLVFGRPVVAGVTPPSLPTPRTSQDPRPVVSLFDAHGRSVSAANMLYVEVERSFFSFSPKLGVVDTNTPTPDPKGDCLTGECDFLHEWIAVPFPIGSATTVSDLTFLLRQDEARCWVWGHDPSYYAELGCTLTKASGFERP